MANRAQELDRWLRPRFGLSALREGQLEVVCSLWDGRTVLFVAPTGHGKSLTYQALAANGKPGVVLVFQPLKALMREQVGKCTAVGLRAAEVTSDSDANAHRAVLARAVRDEFDVLFIAPERLDNSVFQEFVPHLKIKGVVIDEAHCISEWGHDFRPAYQKLVRITMGMGLRTPILAMTATAPDAVVDGIEEQIGSNVRPVATVRLPSHRPNLRLAVVGVIGFEERLAAVLEVAASNAGAGLVYFLTTAETRRAAEVLTALGVPAVAYHGKLEPDERDAALDAWRSNRARVICATSALGMGMDRSDVRWVVHAGLPESLTRYVQEIGRAGRDGAPALALAIDDSQLEEVYDWLVTGTTPPAEDYEAVAAALAAGATTRTRILDEVDINVSTVQAILDDLTDRGLCSRWGSPFVYQWNGGAPAAPAHAEFVHQLRRQRLQEVMDYVDGTDCRAVHLAAVMQDDPLPARCGVCDVCSEAWPWPDVSQVARVEAALRSARHHLGDAPPKDGLARGLALSVYKQSALGRAVAEAKQGTKVPPPEVLAAADAALADPSGPFAGVPFDAVVSIPSTRSGDFVGQFADHLARRLLVRHIPLVKTRETQAQKSLRSRRKQKANVQGALALPAGVPRPKVVLLVDDLWDSGETLREAARILEPATSYPLVMALTRDADDR